jgi:acyl dehydratase
VYRTRVPVGVDATCGTSCNPSRFDENERCDGEGDVVTERTATWPAGMPERGQKAARSRLVTGRDIELFTEISGDRNPIHYDADVARRSRFGGIVVQGGITSGILNAVVAEDLPGPGTVFLQVNWSFKAPVRPGDTITGEVEVSSVRVDKPITELVTRVVRGDGTVVLDGTAVCYTMPLDQ